MSIPNKFPEHLKHIAPNWRTFKQLKRIQLEAVIKAYKEYRLGCAYCPDTPHGLHRVDQILDVGAILQDIRDSLSQRKWGR